MELACDNLSFQYPESTGMIFDRLSFTIQGPGFHAVFAPSGAGKTSLARIISAAVTGYTGEIYLTEIKKIFYSYNTERLPGWSNIGSLLNQITPAGHKALLEELITVFSLENLMDSRYPCLSLGQKNRVNLLRYLVQDFDLLIMDESLANVDEKLRRTILLYIKKRFPDKMFLTISHNLMEVAEFCKEILVLGAQEEPGQGRILRGLDFRQNTTCDRNKLDRCMLEIMNAC